MDSALIALVFMNFVRRSIDRSIDRGTFRNETGGDGAVGGRTSPSRSAEQCAQHQEAAAGRNPNPDAVRLMLHQSERVQVMS